MRYDLNKNVKPGAVFVLSLIPGAGHMYMGLMNRGLQILIGFMLGFAFLGFSYSFNFVIGPAMTVLYIFNIFDAYNCRRQIAQGVDLPDEALVQIGGTTGVYIGAALIAFGFMGLLFTLESLQYMTSLFYDIVGNVIRLLPSLLLLAIGFVLLRNHRKQTRKAKEQKADSGEAA
jgi:hypothetical protein